MKEDIGKGKRQEISCLEGQVLLKLPENWQRPGKEVIAKKFPYYTKPQEIFADLDGRKIITFNLLDKQLQETQVYPAIREIQRLIGRLYPDSIRRTAVLLRVNAGMSGRFLFVTGGMEYDTAHCMFILPVNEKMMFGGYHFPLENRKEEDILLEILKSIRIKDCEKDAGWNLGRAGVFRRGRNR